MKTKEIPSPPRTARDRPREVVIERLKERLNEALAQQRLGDGESTWVTGDEQAWVKEIVSGVLRWKGRLDWIIDQYSSSKKPTGDLRRAMLCAGYQLLGQDEMNVVDSNRGPNSGGKNTQKVPEKIVHEWVDWVKKNVGLPPSRFANAVLRKISDRRSSWMNWAFPTPQGGSADSIEIMEAAWASLPLWFWRDLKAAYGGEWAKAYARASMARPGTWVRVRSADFLPDRAHREVPLPTARWDIGSGNPAQWAGFKDGEFYIQDLSSQWATEWVARQLSGTPAAPAIWDYCAAPGGKAIGLRWAGIEVYASEVNASRRKMMEDNLERTRVDVRWEDVEKPSDELVVGMARGMTGGLGGPGARGPWIVPWVDAPCTGSGTLRRHPEIRWHRTRKDLESLVEVQRQILKRVWSLLPSGGQLIYSVCSVHPAEGIEQARWLVNQDGTLEAHALLAPHLGLPALPGAPSATTQADGNPWPAGEGPDGFWIGLLRKN